MTKKIFLGMSAMAMLFATSCKDDFAESFVGDQATVEFSISTPEIGTRAYSDGTTATKLQYAVYDAEGKKLSLGGEATLIDKATTVKLELTTGESYQMIFWAAAENAPYTVTFTDDIEDAKMEVNYANAVSNDENRDAFYKYHTFTVSGVQTENVQLKRPFAQLNIGTSDYAAATATNYNPTQSKVTVKKIYNTLNLASGKVSGEEEVVFGYANINRGETFPVAGYEYLAMNYLLVPADQEVVDIEFGYKGDNDAEHTRTVGSVPVQRNYRTNIYGKLLTSTVDVNVEIEPDFNEPAHGLAALQNAALNGGEVTLTEDITLTTPLKVYGKMTLNLGGHTITTTEKETGRHHYAIDNYATLVIEGKGAINARGIQNFGTMTIDGKVTITNVDTNGGSAIWNEGKLTINDGTFTTNDQAGAGSYGSALNTQEGGEAIINGGNFITNSQLTYAILNYGTTTINYAVVKGKHGAVASDNIAKTTIYGGSFELMENPGVSDHCAYLVTDIRGGKFTLGNNTDSGAQVFYESTIAAGYKEIEKDGKYYVVPAEAVAVTTANELTNALANGGNVVLTNDIDFGSTQLAIDGENKVVDLGGHTLTTANNWGGISLKNGACIKNGTITHAGNTAAIKAFNGTSVENVTINATCSTADNTVTGIAVQQGANVESIKNVTINGVSQGIEVGYKATVGLIENAVVNESNNGTAKGIGLVINGGMVGKAKDCTFKGETYGITLHLKGVFAAGLELENCEVKGTTASIYAWDEKGISNTSGSLILTYDAATTLTGPFIWDFEDECKGVVTLNKPQ